MWILRHGFSGTRGEKPRCRLRYSVSRLSDLVLVGDSLAMVVYGLETTRGVTLDIMINHGQAVMRGCSRACVVIDLPHGTYEQSPAQAVVAAKRVVDETGCQAVKLEGGEEMAATVRAIVDAGIPVLGHIGLKFRAKATLGPSR